MKKIASVLLFIFLICGSIAQAQTGFLGRNKALSIDINKLLLDHTLNLELNFMIKPNVNLVPSIGYVAFTFRDPYKSLRNYHSTYISQHGPTFGFRLLLNSVITGQIAPLGHYAGYGYNFSSLIQRESKVPIKNTTNPIENKVALHDINIFYGKGFLLSERMVFSFDVAIGMFAGFGYNDSTSTIGFKPLNSYLTIIMEQENFGGETSVSVGYYIRPTLKLTYFFKL